MTRATRAALALVAITLVGCARGVPPTETAQPTSRPPLTTVTPSAAPPSSPSPGPSLPAPTGVRLTGRLPDTKATVPPGEAEAGRVTVHWDVVPGATAYRVYERSCAGATRAALELGRDERQYGPLQPCRPGGDVGVSAVLPSGESPITWARGTP